MHVDPAKRELASWFLGGLPIIVLRPDGGTQTLADRGSPLGSDKFEPGFKSIPLQGGERIFACSDGVIEMTVGDGTPLGRRRLHELLLASNSLPGEEARSRLVSGITSLGGMKGTLEDDCTFAFVDYGRNHVA